MIEFLESVMLICFGVSWPISVVKNWRAKTAQNMSLSFILMIIFGYLAGICAKVMAGNYSYVLVIYGLNLLAVSANLVIYFINRSYDRHRISVA